jgi:hypothetical protein
MSNFDHYEAAQDLISCLEKDGFIEYASRLRSAMEDGATGTEILMGLRFHLSEIIRLLPVTGELQIRALELLAELNDVLE